MKLLISCAAGFILFLTHLQAQERLEEGFTIEWISQDWDQPVDLDFDSHGNMYVTEKAGEVWVVRDGQKSAMPLIDISEEVANFGDNGLLSLALDRDFDTNGYVYLYYVVDRHHWINFGTSNYNSSADEYWNATFSRVTRYEVDIDQGIPTWTPESRLVLIGKNKLDGIPSLYTSHMGGTVMMGDDRSLLVSTGDGSTWVRPYPGGGPPYYEEYVEQGLRDQIIEPHEELGTFRSQYIDNLNGKILRIDPNTGQGLSSNPYYDAADPDASRSKVYALGFRNGFRMQLRKNSGSQDIEQGFPGVIYITDVGNENWEELNVVKLPGQNFGWPLYEGINQMQLMYEADTRHPSYIQSGDCPEEGYLFRDLLQQPVSEFPFIDWTDPCNPNQELSTSFRFEHTLPTLALGHWAVGGYFYVPVFDTDGHPYKKRIDDEDSPVTGVSKDWHGICALAGGFYDSDRFPEFYHGMFFIGDYDRGWIMALRMDDNDDLISVHTFYAAEANISDVEINPYDGALYFIEIENGIRRISYGENIRPQAEAVVDPVFGPSPLTISVDGLSSFDPNDMITDYTWSVDGLEVSSASRDEIVITSDVAGPSSTFVKLSVTDSLGLIGEDSVLVSLNNTPPSAKITSIQDDEFYDVNGITFKTLEAEVSDLEHDTGELTYEWQLFLGHNTHEHAEPIISEVSTTIPILPTICGFETYYYRVALRVTDPLGLVATDEKILRPNCEDSFVDLIHFSHVIQNDEILLTWVTQLENGVSEMIVERQTSSEGPWEELQSLDPSNRGLVRSTYTFEDQRDILGLRNYRIKVLGEQGQEIYSEIIEVDFISKEALVVYPNPTSDILRVVYGELVEDGTFSIYDAGGRIILTERYAKDGPLSHDVNISHLSAGTYMYIMTNGVNEVKDQLVIIN